MMIYGTKTISCTIRAAYYAKITWTSWRTKRSSVGNYTALCYCNYHTYAMRAYLLKLLIKQNLRFDTMCRNLSTKCTKFVPHPDLHPQFFWNEWRGWWVGLNDTKEQHLISVHWPSSSFRVSYSSSSLMRLHSCMIKNTYNCTPNDFGVDRVNEIDWSKYPDVAVVVVECFVVSDLTMNTNLTNSFSIILYFEGDSCFVFRAIT